MDKIDKLKIFLQENYPNEQAFNTRNLIGDNMRTVYDEDGIIVDYCYEYEYIEIFGLTDVEFENLIDDYGMLKNFNDEMMEENSIKNERSSIEEDIIILEQLIIANENCIKNAKNKDNPFVTVWKKQNIAIEHIISEYKRVLKENEELNYKLHSKKIALEIYNRYIPKSKLKEIIDRIDYDIKKTKEIILKNTNIYASYRKNDYQIVRLKAMNTKSLDIKKRLQELLESEE